jgi:peptide/nickel transport system substrate-binding protein
LALLAGTALIAAACGDDDDGGGAGGGTGTESTAESGASDTTGAAEGTQPAGDGAEGGTLVWAHEQEPPDLHLDDPNNNLSIASWMIQGMWEGLYGVSSETTFFPELLAGEPEITENDDGSVAANFTLRDGLTWSDGDDLTADDVKFTYDVIMERGTEDADGDGEMDFIYLIGDRTGYDTITSFEVTSPTEFTITWSAYFGGFPAIFERVMPSHVFTGGAAEVNAALPEWQSPAGGPLPSSGPLVFESWEKGVKMNFVRNDNYHGSVSPDVTNTGIAHVDGVEIRFVADTDAQINALKAGEAQMIFTQPQTAFGEELTTDESFTIASLAGPVFEHWGLNLNNVHLAKVEVREALALAIDKGLVMEALYTPIFGDLLPANGLGNTYWMSNQPTYEDHQGDAGYGTGDIEAARAKLEEAGYVDEGGVYTHPTDGPLTLRVGTTGGNRLREVQQQLLQEQLSEAGFDIQINNVEGGDYFSAQPFNEESLACANSGGAEGNCGLWEIAQFAWVGGPWPGSQSAAYRTGSGNNAYGYANEEFDAKADECDATVDEAESAACYNELDKYTTTLELDPEGGLFMIPLTQKPSFYAYSNTALSGAAVSPDADDAGPLVNVVDYQFAA